MDPRAFTKLQQAIDRARSVVDGAIAAGADVPSSVRIDAAAVFAGWNLLNATLEHAPGRIALTMADPMLSGQGRTDQVGRIMTEVNNAVSSALDAMNAAVDRVVATLKPLTGANRPAPADAAQEARIAGYKADLRMVLDRIDARGAGGNELLDRITSELERQLAEDGELEAWVLASSGWPALYLESVGRADLVRALDESFGKVLDGGSLGSAGVARKVLAAMTGEYGLTDVLRVAQHLVDSETADLRRIAGEKPPPRALGLR